MKRRILVVEDDPAVTELLIDQLGFEGFAVTVAPDARSGLALAAASRPDLILLDVRLPDGSGFDLCRRLRRSGVRVPVIFLTARGDPVEKVRGFDAGADDYVTKPFNPLELTARIEAVLRRAEPATSATIEVGPVEVDLEARRVRRDRRDIALTRTEFDILALLVRRAGAVVSRQEFLDACWQDVFVTPRTVDTHIASLRRKLGDDPRQRLIESVRGIGYRLGVRLRAR